MGNKINKNKESDLLFNNTILFSDDEFQKFQKFQKFYDFYSTKPQSNRFASFSKTWQSFKKQKPNQIYFID